MPSKRFPPTKPKPDASHRGDASHADAAPRDPANAPHAAAGQAMAEHRPYNADKASEYDGRVIAPEGQHVDVTKAEGAGSLSEGNASDKTAGHAVREDGTAQAVGSLGRERSFAGAQALTTNQGVAIANNQSSLKAGLRGPTLLEDFILREKITHFDHERIPERIVHARGSAAHGYFESTADIGNVSKASVFTKGKRTPVFVRFSTVAGERGSTDTARDVRGFAVKFYTDQGNWDLVGNNIPVFFIQDAMKFPDLIHAVKPEPHNGMPQAASAHDTFWDFASLMPESTHTLLWAMSDRAIPRSLRMMQGFGVHTFRLVNEQGQSTFCKFHWTPKLGVHSLAWDEAVKISGADSDFHRRDLWDAIEAGAYPEWELGLQLFTEADAQGWSFDVLDATKLVPEELCPVKPVGRMVLNRNPDNFFAETEQVAFCTAHVVPGIDFSNDPLLAGRHHSYVDTQLSRLGGPNFHELPINAPLAPVANNQRDGIHRQTIHRGRVSYEPNSLGGGCPFQAGMKGFSSFPAPLDDDGAKMRGKPEKFGEHYNQPRMFYNSVTPAEQRHIEGAFRFELSKVTVPTIRQRMVAGLRHVDDAMATRLARDLGIELPVPLPLALESPPKAEVTTSAKLSNTAFPGNGGIDTRKVAILICDGVRSDGLMALCNALVTQGAVVVFVAPRLGVVDAQGQTLPVDGTYENSAAVVFDGVLLPADDASMALLGQLGQAGEFIKNQYRHCKTIGLVGGTAAALANVGMTFDGKDDRAKAVNAEYDPKAGIVTTTPDGAAFIAALAKHRHPAREMDPPRY